MRFRMNLDLIATDAVATSFMDGVLKALNDQNTKLREEYERACEHIADLEAKLDEVARIEPESDGIDSYAMRNIMTTIEEAISEAISECTSNMDEEICKAAEYSAFEPNKDYLPPDLTDTYETNET